MVARPVRRKGKRTHEDAETTSGAFARLLSLGPYDRNQITADQIDRLRELIDQHGGAAAAERVGVCEVTLYRVCAGFGHRLLPPTAAAVRKYLAGSK